MQTASTKAIPTWGEVKSYVKWSLTHSQESLLPGLSGSQTINIAPSSLTLIQGELKVLIELSGMLSDNTEIISFDFMLTTIVSEKLNSLWGKNNSSYSILGNNHGIRHYFNTINLQDYGINSAYIRSDLVVKYWNNPNNYGNGEMSGMDLSLQWNVMSSSTNKKCMISFYKHN